MFKAGVSTLYIYIYILSKKGSNCLIQTILKTSLTSVCVLHTQPVLPCLRKKAIECSRTR